jgi:hypothetical protein
MNHRREPRAKARGVGCCANPEADVSRTRHKTPVKTVRRYEDVDRSNAHSFELCTPGRSHADLLVLP